MFLRRQLTSRDHLFTLLASATLSVFAFFYAVGIIGQSPPANFFTVLARFLIDLPITLAASVMLILASGGISEPVFHSALIAYGSPLISFIFWGLIFYLLALLSKFKFGFRTFSSINLPSILLFVFLSSGLIYDVHQSLAAEHEERILSIVPIPAKIGATVSITVEGISHDAYTEVLLIANLSSAGKTAEGITRGVLWAGKVTPDNIISFPLSPEICNNVSMPECSLVMKIIPGTEYTLDIDSSEQNSHDIMTPFAVEK